MNTPNPTTLPHVIHGRDVPKVVTILSLGESMMDYIGLMMNPDNKEIIWGHDELWTLNTAIDLIRADVGFAMDNLITMRYRYPEYVKRLANILSGPQTPFVITSDGLSEGACELIGCTLYEFPIHDAIAVVGRENAYFHHSVPYMLVYAYMLGVEELRLWGMDYTTKDGRVREEERANCEFWIGWLKAKGMKIITPDCSTILNSHKRHFLYGYRTKSLNEGFVVDS